MRAWARSNGYDVADRGRLPAELTSAYLAAQPGGSAKKAPATRPAAKKAAAKRVPAKRSPAKPAAAKPAVAKTAAAKRGAPVTTVAAVEPEATTTAPTSAPTTAPKPDPGPKPSPVNDDRRLVALGEQLAALTDRVAALEKATGGDKSNGKSVGKRFRRSR